jgi:hypothetical protein
MIRVCSKYVKRTCGDFEDMNIFLFKKSGLLIYCKHILNFAPESGVFEKKQTHNQIPTISSVMSRINESSHHVGMNRSPNILPFCGYQEHSNAMSYYHTIIITQPVIAIRREYNILVYMLTVYFFFLRLTVYYH